MKDEKMTAVLTDVFLMEAYVNEKLPNANTDSLTVLRQSFYKSILKHHKVDSASFFSTFNYFHAHPDEFTVLLNQVDSNMNKIKPLDTTTVIKPVVEPPKNLEILSNFNEQEKAMQKEYLKNQQSSQKFKRKNEKNKE